MKILGIDPGLEGGFAFLAGDTLSIGRLPVTGLTRNRKERSEIDARAFYALLETERPDIFCIENVGGIKGQGAGASFVFGESCGVLRTCCEIYATKVGNRSAVIKISPVVWRARMSVRRECIENRVDAKEGSRRVASKLFPAYSAAWSKKGDDGVAEAVLIAAYWHKFGGIADAA